MLPAHFILLVAIAGFGGLVLMLARLAQYAARARQEHERISQLLDQAADSIFLVGPDGVVIDVNGRGCEMLGYPRAELVGRRVADLLTPEVIADAPERIAALRAGKTLLSEREVVRRDGTRVPVEINSRMLSNGCIQAIARDTSRRRAGHLELRRSEERLRLALEAAGLGLWDHDLRTGERTWSDVGARLLGLSDGKQVTAESFMTCIHPDDRDQVQTEVAEAFRIGGDFRSQFRVKWPDGTIRHVGTLARVYTSPDGAPTRSLGILWDDTARFSSEAALRASEARLRAIVDAEPECVKLVDRDGRLLEMNPAGLRMLDAESLDVVLGEQVNRLVVPEHRDAFDSVIAAAFRGEASGGEFDIVSLHGVSRSMESSVVPLRAEDGAVVAALSITRDVTDRKRAERDLNASQALLGTVLDHAPIVLFGTDHAGRVTVVQGSTLARLGISRDMLMGHSVFDLFPNVPQVIQSMRRALAGEPDQCEVSLADRVLECVFTPMFDVSGTAVVGVTGVASDITERRLTESALRNLEEQNRLLIDNANDTVIAYDMSGRLTFVNRRFEALTGFAIEDAPGMRLHDFLHPADRDGVIDNLKRRLAGEPIPNNYPMRIIRRDGEVRWVDANVSLVRKDGSVLGLQAFVRDITDRVQAEQALRASEERYRSVVDSVREVIFQTDRAANWTFLNPAWTDSTGFDIESSLGRPVLDVVHADDRASFMAHFRSLLDGTVEEWRHELRCVAQGGRVHWMEIMARPIRTPDNDIAGTSGTLNDISERKRAEQALAHEAQHDRLTDLPNRRLLHERLEEAVDRMRTETTPLALLLLDLDGFKEVNDTLGHATGDVVLQHLSERLLAIAEPEDTIARLGGDEFAVVLPDAELHTAVATAHRLRDAMAQPIEVDGLRLAVGASIGLACGPVHGEDAATLLRHADIAMYSAKRSGQGVAVYDPELDGHSADRLALSAELRQAIDRQELILHYQPKVELPSRRAVGVEALVRWQHPRRGLIGPDQFVPLAEQTGLIEPLTRWVLRRALRQQAAWRAEGLDLKVAVNLSMRSLHDARFVETVRNALEEEHQPAEGLELELTETMLMTSPETARTMLNQLRALGVRVALDDFGTGYSSLAYLKGLPIDELKIDRSFIKDATAAEQEAALVRAMIELGHTLGLKVVAEGVETAATLRLLRTLRCDAVQGFYISRPVPGDVLSQWARSSQLRRVA